MPFIMLTMLIDMLAIGLMIPVMPALVGIFTDSKADQAFWYGVVAFTFGLANFFASPVLGALSDRYGRRPVLLLGFFGLGLNFFMTAFATGIVDADRRPLHGRRPAGQCRGCQCLCRRHHRTRPSAHAASACSAP